MSDRLTLAKAITAAFYDLLPDGTTAGQVQDAGFAAADAVAALLDAAPTTARDVVSQQDIANQRAKGWADWHPEHYCHRCGHPNVRSWWVASDLWNRVMVGHEHEWNGIVCPQCFDALAAEAGITCSWELSPDPRTLRVNGERASGVLGSPADTDDLPVCAGCKEPIHPDQASHTAKDRPDFHWLDDGKTRHLSCRLHQGEISAANARADDLRTRVLTLADDAEPMVTEAEYHDRSLVAKPVRCVAASDLRAVVAEAARAGGDTRQEDG